MAADHAESLVLIETHGPVALVTMNRPAYRNAQNVALTHAIDDAFKSTMKDDAVKVVVLAGAGKHFSAGHDIGTPERDIHEDFPRVATDYWDHAGRPGAEDLYIREAEAYLGMCRRWRELPKPTIAMVQGACIAGALMLAWSCDLVVASEDAFFSDPVLRMGIPGVEYFAHPFVMPPRIAKEFLFTGARMSAQRAEGLGMVNRVVPRDQLLTETMALAQQVAEMPRFALSLAKKAINQAEDRMGLRDTMDASFALHHLAHAHNALSSDDHLQGQDARSMKAAAERAASTDTGSSRDKDGSD